MHHEYKFIFPFLILQIIIMSEIYDIFSYYSVEYIIFLDSLDKVQIFYQKYYKK